MWQALIRVRWGRRACSFAEHELHAVAARMEAAFQVLAGLWFRGLQGRRASSFAEQEVWGRRFRVALEGLRRGCCLGSKVMGCAWFYWRECGSQGRCAYQKRGALTFFRLLG